MSEVNHTAADYPAAALHCFSFLAEQFNYTLIAVTEKRFFCRHVYRNRWKRRKIVIENNSFPGDHGFGFFIYKYWTKEYHLLHNQWIPADRITETLEEIKRQLLGYPKFVSIIMGKKWKLNPKDFEEYENRKIR